MSRHGLFFAEFCDIVESTDQNGSIYRRFICYKRMDRQFVKVLNDFDSLIDTLSKSLLSMHAQVKGGQIVVAIYLINIVTSCRYTLGCFIQYD